MKRFAYTVKNPAGVQESGWTGGAGLDEVLARLHAEGHIVLRVVESKPLAPRIGILGRVRAISLNRVGSRDLALFTRQLCTTLDAGIPLVRGLRGLAADMPNRTLASAVGDLADRIERGEGLSDAMGAHPEAFDALYLSMLRAGERAGTLSPILDQLAAYLERMDGIQTKVRSALSYPLFVLLFALGASTFLLLKVVPSFKEIYADMGQSLPAVTTAVMSASAWVQGRWLAVAAGAACLGMLAALWRRTRSGRLATDHLLLKLPIFGGLVTKAVMGRFARTLGILLASGLPILDALSLSRGASNNAVVAGAVEAAQTKIAAGQGITAAFRSTGRFPEMLMQLLATGEESGELDGMLLKGAEFYDRQVEAAVNGLTSLIEPVMVVAVGGVIGIIVVAMFLPVLHLGEAVMRGGYGL